ncbi:phosphodiester glycosidase family protein [Proteiniphilum sp. UBA5384]|uniref:phosphodiester glycosidase family protein n=1 Tax=Proteiniphilum sp. UBA5384 TaxID=1947279 RepID=UPI0025D3C0A6|nr:phosphodiester glycosidase family protein [Proteiniphilum sp. UBA5384]
MKSKNITFFLFIITLFFSIGAYAQKSKVLSEYTGLIKAIYSDVNYGVTDGVKSTEIAFEATNGKAMKIFILEVDLQQPSLSLKVTMPDGRNSYGMQQMTRQAASMDSVGHVVWAGVNADFYDMKTGVPRGVLHRNGQILKTNYDEGNRGFFAITKDKKALAGTNKEYPGVSSSLQLQEVVGGGAILLKNGVPLSQSNKTVEPRTCVGITADSTRVFFLAVDGRDVPYSNGMTLEELAMCLKALGAHNAINLDGGGSTTYFVRRFPAFRDDRFDIRNRPSDYSGERAVANGIVVISNL